MKKFLFLTLIFATAISMNTYAQAGDPPSILQQMKDKTVPLMVEKTGLTVAQAEKIVEINYEMRESMRAFANLEGEERSKKIAEMKAARDKKWSEIPLTAEQIAAVKTFYENMGKNAPPKNGN